VRAKHVLTLSIGGAEPHWLTAPDSTPRTCAYALAPTGMRFNRAFRGRSPVPPRPRWSLLAHRSEEGTTPREDVMVQYVLVRRDLHGALGWPLGSVVAQV